MITSAESYTTVMLCDQSRYTALMPCNESITGILRVGSDCFDVRVQALQLPCGIKQTDANVLRRTFPTLLPLLRVVPATPARALADPLMKCEDGRKTFYARMEGPSGFYGLSGTWVWPGEFDPPDAPPDTGYGGGPQPGPPGSPARNAGADEFATPPQTVPMRAAPGTAPPGAPHARRRLNTVPFDTPQRTVPLRAPRGTTPPAAPMVQREPARPAVN
jgi:hypothetical protein